jgi:hypothetical protein
MRSISSSSRSSLPWTEAILAATDGAVSARGSVLPTGGQVVNGREALTQVTTTLRRCADQLERMTSRCALPCPEARYRARVHTWIPEPCGRCRGAASKMPGRAWQRVWDWELISDAALTCAALIVPGSQLVYSQKPATFPCFRRAARGTARRAVCYLGVHWKLAIRDRANRSAGTDRSRLARAPDALPRRSRPLSKPARHASAWLFR